MATLVPTSKLDAVNSILLGIGEAPVNTLGSGLQEAEIAEVTLNNINREVQTIGWHFNTEVRYSLGKNSDGIILDLRGNGGGSLFEAYSLAKLFMALL